MMASLDMKSVQLKICQYTDSFIYTVYFPAII